MNSWVGESSKEQQANNTNLEKAILNKWNVTVCDYTREPGGTAKKKDWKGMGVCNRVNTN